MLKGSMLLLPLANVSHTHSLGEGCKESVHYLVDASCQSLKTSENTILRVYNNLRDRNQTHVLIML
jgi:hypothetical protein